jgi:RNA polymerase sigma-70 factor (ECF subfamily)
VLTDTRTNGMHDPANLRPVRVSLGATAVDAQFPLSSRSDAECVQLARGGQADGLNELIRRYQQRATSVAYRLLGNLHDALEVCQEAFIRAFRRLDSLEDPRSFRPWLLRIVTNLSLNYRRSRAAGGPRISIEDCLLDPDSPAEHLLNRNGDQERPGDELAAAELAEAIRVALSELTESQRVALVLFSIEQIPQKEVAEIMSCSVEAVKWHVFQARKRLRERLAAFL